MTDYAELCERLKAKARTSFEANKSFGRRGKEWAIETESDWQAAAAIERLSAENEALRRVVKQVSLLTVEGKDHTEFAAQYPTFAGLVEEARATLKGADHD